MKVDYWIVINNIFYSYLWVYEFNFVFIFFNGENLKTIDLATTSDNQLKQSKAFLLRIYVEIVLGLHSSKEPLLDCPWTLCNQYCISISFICTFHETNLTILSNIYTQNSIFEANLPRICMSSFTELIKVDIFVLEVLPDS